MKDTLMQPVPVRSAPRPRWLIRAAAGVLALAALVAPTAAWADDSDGGAGDPNLAQTIDPNDPIVAGDAVLTTGHVDMGPKFDGTTWRFLLHDDAKRADADAQSVWRDPAHTVLRLADAAKLRVPDSETYSFVGAKPGSEVWVIPQTQAPDVVWAGWNTQDPTVMSKLDRGATFSVDGVQGPGTMTVSLQSGDFGAPQVLWDSRKTGSQPVFVDTNTHTHANWIFTKPGVYLVEMTAAATLIDGSTVTDTEYLRFAVGSATSTADALAAKWEGPKPSDASSAANESAAASKRTVPSVPLAGSDDASGQSPLVVVLIAAIVLVALALIIGFAVVIVRGNQTKKRVLASRSSTARARDVAPDASSSPGGGEPGRNPDGGAA